ncbi:MAG: hypothetical protein UT36_C0008G0042 [Candidatus Peregrinibacteria bacterium GW2011_GWF2_39_17]|nr:MAG: hypothetical protein UT36_C0008G0042 [Candidatus Peregrinibacteria bacterium GW2011_GWF2_39_17]HCW32081.1 hypothetical protein [Candidatus Peregrinibacteria bacterium]
MAENKANPNISPETQVSSVPISQNEPKNTDNPGLQIPTDERLLGAASYIPMLFVGAITMKPKSKFCQMHGKQGLLLTIIAFFTLFILILMPAIGSLLFLTLIAVSAIGAFQAYSGILWPIPILHNLAMKINVDQMFAKTGIEPAKTTPVKPNSDQDSPNPTPNP